MLSALQSARLSTRAEMLDHITMVDESDRRFRQLPGVVRLEDDVRSKVEAAFERYLETIPETQRFRGITYAIKDVIAKTGFGIGSAGLPSYTILIEGFNQALDNDVVLSMKQGNVAAPSRVVDDPGCARVLQASRASDSSLAARITSTRRPSARLHRYRRGRVRGQRTFTL